MSSLVRVAVCESELFGLGIDGSLIIVIFAELGGFLGIWYGGLYNHRDYWPGTATGWEVVQRGSGR